MAQIDMTEHWQRCTKAVAGPDRFVPRVCSRLLIAAFVIASAQTAGAQSCPTNAHVDHVEQQGDITRIICKCDPGYQKTGGACVSPATRHRIQVKSFIATVDLNDPGQFDSASARGEKLQAFAVNRTLSGGENPTDGDVDTGQFRLWSQVDVDAQCKSDKITRWTFSKVTTSFGKEAFFQTSGEVAKPLTIFTQPNGQRTVDRVSFRYRVRGRPIAAVNLALASARPRTCTYIWHEIAGTLTCKNGMPSIEASLTGSGFPSHRLWINGTKVSDLPQGAFRKLWDCDPADPTSVR